MSTSAPLSPTPPSVSDATNWCLEHLDAHPAVLVGVEPGTRSADFHVVPLCADDLLDDVAGLRLPGSWTVCVVVCDGPLLGEVGWDRLALGVDRLGSRHLCGRSFDGRTWEVPPAA